MNEKTNEEEFEEMKGKYPNKHGSGIGEGHVKAFMHCYKKWENLYIHNYFFLWNKHYF